MAKNSIPLIRTMVDSVRLEKMKIKKINVKRASFLMMLKSNRKAKATT